MEVVPQPSAPEGGMNSPAGEFVSMAQFGQAGVTPEAGPAEASVEPSVDFEGQAAEAPVEERFFEIPDIRDPNRVYKRVSEAKIPEMIQQQDAYIADLHGKIKQYEAYLEQVQRQQQAPVQPQQDSRLGEYVSSLESEIRQLYPNADPEAVREQAVIQAKAAILAEDRALNAFQRQNAERDMRSFIAANPILTSPLGIQIAERFGVTGQQHLELCNLLKPIIEQQQAQPQQQQAQQVVAQRVEQQRQALPPSSIGGKSVTPTQANPKVVQAYNNWVSTAGRNRSDADKQAMFETINQTFNQKYGA